MVIKSGDPKDSSAGIEGDDTANTASSTSPTSPASSTSPSPSGAAPSTTSAGAPPDEPIRTTTQASGEESAAQSGEDTTVGEVELYLTYPQDVFRYGDGPDDVLEGHKAKKFSQGDATKIRELAAYNNVLLMERKPEGDNS